MGEPDESAEEGGQGAFKVGENELGSANGGPEEAETV